MNSIIKFEIGKTYSTRSICDHNCIISVTIAKRTAKTITTTEGKIFRPGVYNNAECIQPWGRASMSPSIDATDTKELKPDFDQPKRTATPTPVYNADGTVSHSRLVYSN